MEHAMRLMLIAVVALAVGATAADAAPKHKRKHIRPAAPPVTYAPPGIAAWPTRPAWAAPGECFTDDGYGRFRSCSAGPNPGAR